MTPPCMCGHNEDSHYGDNAMVGRACVDLDEYNVRCFCKSYQADLSYFERPQKRLV